MEKKQTPEEKLLRLIENPGKDIKDVLPRRRGFRFNLAWIRNIRLPKGKLQPYLLFNLKTINKGLVVVSVLITLYLIIDFIKERPDLNQIYASEVLGHRRDIKTSARAELMNLADYLSQIERRDIFHLVPLKKEETIPTAKETLVSLSGNLKLVGIIWGKSPQAMIEDKQENKTMLLNQGDEIGKLKIRQILRDRVILGYEDQEMELM
jgi:type II secretory pathway component PulC